MSYPSLTNIAPHVWGPHGWKFFHAVALTYPDQPSAEEKQAAFQFFSSLQYLLPCESCKQNYRKELTMFPLQPALESKQALNKWLASVHNSVNERLKKPVMSTEQILEYVFKSTPPHHSGTTTSSSTAGTAGTAGTDNTNNNSSTNIWGIAVTCVAAVLFVAVLLLATLYQKQKKLLRK